MGTPIHGFNGYLYLGTTNAAPVGEITEYSLEMDADLQETTSLGDSWEERVKGPMKWSAKASGNFDTAANDLWTIATSTTISKMYLYADRSGTGRYYYGTAWLKLPTILSGGVKQKASVALSLDGSGTLATN